MRTAIISDIHGNLVALEAVMRDLEVTSPDEVWCGGDLAWAGPWGRECLQAVRKAGWPCVRGNADIWATGDPQTASTDEDRRWVAAMAAAHALSEEDARWLVGLPLGHTGPAGTLLVHGTPASPFEAPQPDAPPSEFAAYEGQADVIVYAHVHKAFVRRLTDGTLLANTGSVGLPLDGPDATYLVVDREGPDVTFRHRRVPFDRAAVLAAAERAGPPIAEWFSQKLGEGERGI